MTHIAMLCCPVYPFGKAATDLIITEPFDAILAHAFVMHQRIKLIFQQTPFIGFRIAEKLLGGKRTTERICGQESFYNSPEDRRVRSGKWVPLLPGVVVRITPDGIKIEMPS